MPLTRKQRIEYLQALWEVFQEKSGLDRDMTNSEYHFAAKWLDAGIPLRVVCTAIEGYEGTPRRLEAVEVPVQKEHERWSQAMGPSW